MNRTARRVRGRGAVPTLAKSGYPLQLEDRTVPTVLDLTTAGASGFLNGALFEQTATQATGTGRIDAIVRLHGSPVEAGYNSDHRPVEFDEKTGPNFTRSVQLGDVATEVRNGVRYRKFLLDVNETQPGKFLSLDVLQISTSDQPQLTGYTADGTYGGQAVRRFDLDVGADGESSIRLDSALNHGSGSGDMVAYVPNRLFDGLGGDTYLYLFSTFGLNDGADGGFEEWALVGGGGATPNLAPVANDDDATTTLVQPVFVPVLANDTDPDGDALTVTAVTQPTHGAVVVNADGTVTYTPNAGFRGSDGFTYSASDGFGGSDTAAVTIAVGLPGGSGGEGGDGGGDGDDGNGPPIVNGDAAVTAPDQPVTTPVLSNDADPGGHPLSIAGASQPTNGTVLVNADGTVTYTPNPGFVGTDRFVYTATDGAGGSRSAEVQVTVGRGGRGPVLFELKYYAVGADTLGGPRVTVYNPDGSVRFDFFAYDPSTRFGANVVLGDLTGDGVPDVITSPGYGGAPHVRVLDGTSLAPVVEFFAFDSDFRGGCTLAVGDVSGDGVPDLAVAAGQGGGPRVFVIDGTKIDQIGAGGLIAPAALLADFFAFDASFGGGVSVAIGDRDGDGVGEVVTGSGPGGPPLVRVWDVPTGAMLAEFLAFDPSFSAGVNVGARGEFIALGAGRGADPIVRVFRGIDHELVSELVAYEPAFRGGCRVAFGETVDPTRPLFLAGAGPTGGPRIKVLRPDLEVVLPDYFSFEDTFRGGVFVA